MLQKLKELIEEVDPTSGKREKKNLLFAIGGVAVGIVLMAIVVIFQSLSNSN